MLGKIIHNSLEQHKYEIYTEIFKGNTGVGVKYVKYSRYCNKKR